MTPLHKYDYASLLRHPQKTERKSCFLHTPVFLHIIIGAMGRTSHLHTSLRYLKKAAQYCNAVTDGHRMDIEVTVVETNHQPSADLDSFLSIPICR